MKVYFIIRFSILDPTSKGFLITRDKDGYKDSLFNTQRLDAKFEAFEKVTLPSIVNQTDNSYTCLIFASTYLPNSYKEWLDLLVAPHNNILVMYITSFDQFHDTLKKYNYGDNYATVRLDDDDGLKRTFVRSLQKYKHKDKHIVSFPHGRRYTIKNGNIIISDKPYEKKNIALGLSAINMNIYTCGSHTTVDSRYPVIYDNTPYSYLLFCSPYCDTNRPFN